MHLKSPVSGQNKARQQKSEKVRQMQAWPQTERVRTAKGRTLSGRRDLPCPVRLKLPPSQSASLVQLALPWSCYTQEIGVSVCTHPLKCRCEEASTFHT